jgi:hypothetical protein
LGPITSGLGEVFQYTLVSKDKKYDATELRTVQDYIVRPLLRTVPGVTDVNSFGGLVKQYQAPPVAGCHSRRARTRWLICTGADDRYRISTLAR